MNGLRGVRVKHGMAFRLALQRLWSRRWANGLTIMVIAISLTLPAFLGLVVKNLQGMSYSWQDSTQLSLFLQKELTKAQTTALVQKIEAYPQVAYLNYISPQQGLHLLEEQSGASDLLQQLNQNPLPAVIELFPKAELDGVQAIEQLSNRLQALPEVALVKIDMQWIKRLNAFLLLIKNTVWLVAALLGIAVVLSISNTIRLLAQSHRKEIEVLKLIGATDSFIARPFLYYGILFGLIGALLACVAVSVISVWTNTMVVDLAQLYYSNFQFNGLNLRYGMIIALSGVVLGIVGAKIAVNQQIRELKPSLN